MRLIFKLFLNEVGFFNEVTYFGLDFVRDFILLAHLMEGLEFLAFGYFVLADGTDKCPHSTDVVGKSNAAEGFNEDENDGFIIVGCS